MTGEESDSPAWEKQAALPPVKSVHGGVLQASQYSASVPLLFHLSVFSASWSLTLNSNVWTTVQRVPW